MGRLLGRGDEGKEAAAAREVEPGMSGLSYSELERIFRRRLAELRKATNDSAPTPPQIVFEAQQSEGEGSGSRYVFYSDASIEAYTGDHMFKFSSWQEFNVFLRDR